MPRFLPRIGPIVVLLAIVAALVIGDKPFQSPPTEETAEQSATSSRPTIQILATFPHDTDAFTQGLTVIKRDNKKFLVESTGLNGNSSLRLVDITTGDVLDKFDLPEEIFGEGVTRGPNGEFVMITYKNKIGLVFDLEDTGGFNLKGTFKFKTVTGEGWGIDFDGKDFAVSDGSSTIMFWDPKTLQEVRRVNVTIDNGEQSISKINELEVAKGYIYANVWYESYILKIDPQTGAVVSMWDLTKLVEEVDPDVESGAVLNGIAYDKEEDVFYVTGKLWNTMYKLRLLDNA